MNSTSNQILGTDRNGPFMKVIKNILASSIVCFCLLVQAADNQPVVHLEGFSTLRTFGRDGRIIQQKPAERFSLWLSGCQWAVYLYADTNRPGGITEVTCDATNVYVFVPDAGGNTLVNNKLEPFLQAGDVYPGTIKLFPFKMGPIWWAYCSSCETDGGNGIIPDFMNLLGGGVEARLRMHDAGTNVKARIGPIEEWLTLTNDLSNQGAPLAKVTPLEVVETNGISLVTSCNVVIYYTSGLSNNAPQPSSEYILTISGLVIETNNAHFIPGISAQSLIADYRSPYSGEYLSNHWLAAEERKSVFRTL